MVQMFDFLADAIVVLDPVNDTREHVFDAILSHLSKSEYVEVTCDPGTDFHPATARDPHGRDDENILDLLEFEVRKVGLEPALVEPQPQQLQHGLRALLLLPRHVEIIYELNPSFVIFRPEGVVGLPPFHLRSQ